MAQRLFKDKAQNILTWVEVFRHYWTELQGDLYNNVEFWDNTYHSMEDQDFWDLIDVMGAVKIQYPEVCRKYSKLDDDLDTILKRLHKGKAVIKPQAKGHNTPVFRAWMIVKDIFNDIDGTPTVQYERVEPKSDKELKIDAKISTFERLFEVE